MFTFEDFLKRAQPGDILLTQNPVGLGKLISFGQCLEDGRDGSGGRYGHVAIVACKEGKGGEKYWKPDGFLYESVMTISRNHIKKYHQKPCCLIRHSGMDARRYFKGMKEVGDNLGQIYPAHRLLFHGLDMINSWLKRNVFRSTTPLKFRYMKLMLLDWPVCSELGAQFIHSAGLRGGWEEKKNGWKGVNPDDFYDCCSLRDDLWCVMAEGTFIFR